MKITPRIRFSVYTVLIIVACFAVAWGATRVVRGVEALMFSDRAYSPSEYRR